MSDVNNR